MKGYFYDFEHKKNQNVQLEDKIKFENITFFTYLSLTGNTNNFAKVLILPILVTFPATILFPTSEWNTHIWSRGLFQKRKIKEEMRDLISMLSI